MCRSCSQCRLCRQIASVQHALPRQFNTHLQAYSARCVALAFSALTQWLATADQGALQRARLPNHLLARPGVSAAQGVGSMLARPRQSIVASLPRLSANASSARVHSPTEDELAMNAFLIDVALPAGTRLAAEEPLDAAWRVPRELVQMQKDGVCVVCIVLWSCEVSLCERSGSAFLFVHLANDHRSKAVRRACLYCKRIDHKQR